MAFGLNPLYVTNTSLNQYLVDKSTGAPLAGGTVYFYQDINRTTLKSVYQLTQLAGPPSNNYSYVALPNPIVLSGVGTIADPNSGDQIPLYYLPYTNLIDNVMDLYYIEVYDANGLLQFTREAWPYPNISGSGGGGSGTVNNGTQNQIAYYAATGTTISGFGPAANSIVVTTNSSVPTLSQTLPTQVIVASKLITTVNVQTFTGSGTYTPTLNMVYCIIEILGGGGAGGGGGATGGAEHSSGSGGGGGEYASGHFSATTIGASQTVTIGAGGTGNSGTTGGNGGNSSVGALISANGGGGGPSVAPTGSPGFAQGGAGGTGGSGGDFRTPGQNGFWTISNFTGGDNIGGPGANSQYGSGGLIGNAATGGAAGGYGAGGGGTSNPQSAAALTGGAGSAGIVIVTEYIS